MMRYFGFCVSLGDFCQDFAGILQHFQIVSQQINVHASMVMGI